MIPMALSAAVIVAAGCSAPSPSAALPAAPTPSLTASQTKASHRAGSTEIEGAWNGVEITHDNEGPVTLTISDQTLEFHGHEDGDWVKGTFTLRDDVTPKQLIGVITGCPDPDGIGKKCYAIYKIADGTLTITGSAPGEENFPASFDVQGSREFVFKQGQ
jgi:uncharacterized protein (TIGR03067 family)